MIKKVLNKIKLSDALICSVLLILVAFFSGSYALFFGTVLLLAGLLFGLAFYQHKKGVFDKRNFNYSVIFFIIIGLSSIIVLARNFSSVNTLIGITVILLSIALIATGITLVPLLKTANKITLDFVLKCLPFAAAAVLLFVLSLPLFKTVPLFDEVFYFDSMVNSVEFYTLNDSNALKLCSHMTHFWSISVYILSCILGELYRAFILLNVLLLIVFFATAYKILRLVCPKSRRAFAYICAVGITLSPFAFGFAGYMYPQTILGYTALFFLYARLTKDKVLTFITAALLAFSFETGIFLTAFLFFIPLFFHLIKSVSNKNFVTELKRQCLNPLNIAMFLLHVVWLVIFLQQNWGGIGNDGGAGGNLAYKFNTPLYTNLTLLTSFHWIIYLGIIAGLIKLFVNIHRGKLSIKELFSNNVIVAIFAAYFICLVSASFITTLNYVRYILPLFIYSYFLFFASIHYLFSDLNTKKVRKALIYGLPVCLSLVLVVQSNITIDPVMLLIKEKTYMGSGNNYVANVAYNRHDEQPYDFTWGDFFDPYVYNNQVNNFSHTFNKALGSINYNLEKCLVVSFDLSNQYILENKYYGLGFPHINMSRFHGWDNTEKRQYITNDKEKAIRYTIREDEDSMLALLTEGEYSEYWFLDYNSGLAPSIQSLAALGSGIRIEENHSVSYMGWKFTLTKISLD